MIKWNRVKIIFLGVLVIILLLLTALGSWYFTPKTFLPGIEPTEVYRIRVFNGNTGREFYIDRDSDIWAVVENIQEFPMNRGKLSSNYDGFAFSLTFLDADESPIDSFVVNGLNTIRDDPFFYHTSEGVLCFEHLAELEKQYFMEDGQ